MAPRNGKSKYKFEVRWSSGKYYLCDILSENKYFAPGTNYNIEGTEEDGKIWHANVPIENLRLVGSAEKNLEITLLVVFIIFLIYLLYKFRKQKKK